MDETAALATPDASRLEIFMRRRLGPTVVVSEFEPITGGYSRFMARFAVEDAGVVTRYILRTDPEPGTTFIDSSRRDEWEVVTAVHRAGTVRVPEPLWIDESGADLGRPGIVYEMVEGENLLAKVSAEVNPDLASYASRVAQTAAQVHRTPLEGLPPCLSIPSDWDSYMSSSIARWRAEESAHVESEPFLRLCASWLEVHRPAAAPLVLVHGDFQISNLIWPLRGDAIVVDWELTRVGDPREDLGWWMLSEAATPTNIMASDPAHFCDVYRAETGMTEDLINPATLAYFTVFASAHVYLSMLGSIGQLARGESTSARHSYLTVSANFVHGVWMDSMQAAADWTGAS